MIRYALDATILVALCQSTPDARLAEWMREQPDETLFVTTVTLAELQRSILSIPDARRRKELARWFEGTQGPASVFTGRILDFDARAATLWATTTAERPPRPSPTCDLDSMQAAIAGANDCIIVTTQPSVYGRARTFNPQKTNVV